MQRAKSPRLRRSAYQPHPNTPNAPKTQSSKIFSFQLLRALKLNTQPMATSKSRVQLAIGKLLPFQIFWDGTIKHGKLCANLPRAAATDAGAERDSEIRVENVGPARCRAIPPLRRGVFLSRDNGLRTFPSKPLGRWIEQF